MYYIWEGIRIQPVDDKIGNTVILSECRVLGVFEGHLHGLCCVHVSLLVKLRAAGRKLAAATFQGDEVLAVVASG